ncbi:MAG: hypothetical protein NTV01_09155 [Bacteroidia bacterium]|nr:hypothetical protein [Bacteroidia bacterium]
MITRWLLKVFAFTYFIKRCRWIGLSAIIGFSVMAGMPENGFGQHGPVTNYFIDSILSQEELSPHVVWYVAGANVGSRGDTNLFARTYCQRMREIMGSKFFVVHCTDKSSTVGNGLWALWHGQYPIKNPMHDKRIRNSIIRLMADSINRKSQITLISSSYGTVVAAQLALYLVNNRQSLGLGPDPVNLVFGASMLSDKSRLFKDLEKLKNENQIGSIVYEELQYPGDNVSGMCGTTRLHAISEVIRIACPVIGKYRGQPSIFNKDPVTGHTHRKREISADQVNDYFSTPLIKYQLAGPWFKIRALESLSR